jgi:hypothetical protein
MFTVSTSTISLVAALLMKLVARRPSLLILRAMLMVKRPVRRLLISALQRNSLERNPLLDGSDGNRVALESERAIWRTVALLRSLHTEVHELPVIVGLDSHHEGGIGQGDGFNGYALGKGVAGNGVGVCEVLLGEPDHTLQPLGHQSVGLVLNRSIGKAHTEVSQGFLL